MSNNRPQPNQPQPNQPQPYQVVQPVTMTGQDARTQAYLQHSMAPIAPTGGSAGQGLAFFPGAFPAFAAAGIPAFNSFMPLVPSAAQHPQPAPIAAPAAPAATAAAASPAPLAQPPAVAAPVENALSDVKGVDSKPSSTQPAATTYAELEEMIGAHGSRISLPADDVKDFEFNFLNPTVKQFIAGNPLLDRMAMVEYKCLEIVRSTPPPAPNSPITIVDVAKHLLNFLSAVNQLPGWSHVERYIRNPLEYMGASDATRPPVVSTAATATAGPVDELTADGNRLLKKLFMRINWVHQLEAKDSKQKGQNPNPEIYLRAISADRNWASEANLFMKDAEVKVTKMLTDNQAKFHEFREWQRKGVQWPHSAAARKEIEAAGLVFRPMMIKRDRCVCETCLIEVSGWRPWQNAYAYHDYSRHMPVFLEKAREKSAGNLPVMMVLDIWRDRSRAAAQATTSNQATAQAAGIPTQPASGTANPPQDIAPTPGLKR